MTNSLFTKSNELKSYANATQWAVTRFRRIWPILSAFAAGQGCAQALNILSGFCVIRWLSIHEYGQYGLAYSVQATVSILVDLGFAATIIALVGHRTEQPSVIGSYIRSGRSIRLKTFYILIPISSAAFLYLSSLQRWPLGLQLAVLASIVVSVYASGIQAYYGAPLIISKKLRAYYNLQIVGAMIRIIGLFVLYQSHYLNVISALWLNTLASTAMAMSTKAKASPLVDEPDEPNPAFTRQMIASILPNLPSIVFFALQGQIAVFLVAMFSHASSVAQVSVLGRLAQLFVFLNAFNLTVVEPWLAKAHNKQVYKKFSLVFGASLAISTCLIIIARQVPQIFLFILGANYYDLTDALTWSVSSSCAWYLISVVWTVIRARRFIFWEMTWLNIGLIVLVQIGFIIKFGVATPIRAMQFSLIAAVASLTAHLINFVYGMSRGPSVIISLEEAA